MYHFKISHIFQFAAYLSVVVAGLAVPLPAQSFNVNKVEPPNWWCGMRDTTLQLMVYGENLDSMTVYINSPDISVRNTFEPENSSYLFINLTVPNHTPAGEYPLHFSKKNDQQVIAYQLLERSGTNTGHQGFGPEDVIYLITPDRFDDGDPSNNMISGMRDGYAPGVKIGRHGGDIAGIIKRLPYMADLGITAIWINPLLENDMPVSYHGYAATDLYRIDPRFGSNELYRDLVSEAHSYGIKIIIDHVSNHIGLFHPWIADLPMVDWLNGSVAHHQLTRHHKEVEHDIHSDSLEYVNLKEGWFVDELPDLNQKNPYLARYLITNTIWWLEYSAADGIREDTYPYADESYLAEWARCIFNEYPELNIVGEIWIQDPDFLAAYMKDSYLTGSFNTDLPVVTDFGLFEALGRVFNRDQSIDALYRFISKDFLYPHPDNLLIFADNHDVMRTMDMVHNDRARYRMIFKILMTMRGIPQIYYGSEIGLSGGGSREDGDIRCNFPGGFPGDPMNAFTAKGRTEDQQEMFDLFRRLILIRKQNKALFSGSLTHLPPSGEVYIYFRMTADQTVMVVVNKNPDPKKLDLNRISRYTRGYSRFRELVTNETVELANQTEITLPAEDVLICLMLK
jgi:glycosidase